MVLLERLELSASPLRRVGCRVLRPDAQAPGSTLIALALMQESNWEAALEDDYELVHLILSGPFARGGTTVEERIYPASST